MNETTNKRITDLFDIVADLRFLNQGKSIYDVERALRISSSKAIVTCQLKKKKAVYVGRLK